MKTWLGIFLSILQCFALVGRAESVAPTKVYILPIRDDIFSSMVYLVRRGVKDAMDAKADVLIIDMDTNGGSVKSTEEIIDILNQFKGKKITYVNKKAFSAGSFISFATEKIYMAPQSVIGAAAPIIVSPTGDGVQNIPETYEAKMTSAVSALVRANAQKNGHNVEVADAMVKRTKELKIDGKVLNEKGQILTLTDKEAAEEYGDPPKALLSAGTFSSLDDLLKELGYDKAEIKHIEETGTAKAAAWINAIAPVLLIIGVIGAYIEFKTPGFGLPGIISIVSFALYFFGGYLAGLSGPLWMFIFIGGVLLVISELFLHPGVIVPGLVGAIMIFVAIIMATVDVYPGGPMLPTAPIAWRSLEASFVNLLIAMFGSVLAVVILARILPKTSMYHRLVSQTVSGGMTDLQADQKRISREGLVGIATSALRPGGKAQFGDEILDVISQGELIAKGQKVKIIGSSGMQALVEAVK